MTLACRQTGRSIKSLDNLGSNYFHVKMDTIVADMHLHNNRNQAHPLPNLFDRLPYELVLKILHFVKGPFANPEILLLARLSRRFHLIVKDESLWSTIHCGIYGCECDCLCGNIPFQERHKLPTLTSGMRLLNSPTVSVKALRMCQCCFRTVLANTSCMSQAQSMHISGPNISSSGSPFRFYCTSFCSLMRYHKNCPEGENPSVKEIVFTDVSMEITFLISVASVCRSGASLIFDRCRIDCSAYELGARNHESLQICPRSQLHLTFQHCWFQGAYDISFFRDVGTFRISHCVITTRLPTSSTPEDIPVLSVGCMAVRPKLNRPQDAATIAEYKAAYEKVKMVMEQDNPGPGWYNLLVDYLWTQAEGTSRSVAVVAGELKESDATSF